MVGTESALRERGAEIAAEAFARVLREGGRLPLTDVLRCRVRHFTDGAVLGSQAFVATQLAAYRNKHGQRARTVPRALPPLTDWSGLATLRSLRQNPFGG